MDKLVALILEHKEDFYHASKKRMSTSYGNRQLHLDMIETLEREDLVMQEVALRAQLFNEYYHKPLLGVIYCLDVPFKVKEQFIAAYQEIV